MGALYRFHRWLDDLPEPKRGIICLGGLAALIFVPPFLPFSWIDPALPMIVAILAFSRVAYLNGWGK